MERKTKGQVVQIVIIIILAVLLVVSLGLGATFAWFSNQNQADVTMTMGGKILIKLENSDTEEGGSKTATFVNRKDLLPGMNVESDVNILISQSNTPCFLRAKIDTTVTPKDNTFQLSANSKQQIINTFNDGIQKVIDKTGVLYVKSSDLTGGPGYGNTITAGVRWILYDGWFYLVTVDQDMSATEPEDINLLNVYTGESDLLLPFVVGDFNLPGEEWGNDLKDCDITFDITAQAVQIFQTKKVGDERYTYHNETLDELGSVIHCAKSTVKGYENGSRKPDLQTLQVLASHYNKPVDELLYADLTGLESKKMFLYLI